MPARTEITTQQLSRLIGAPDAPPLVDICIEDDFALDPRLIPGAFRWPYHRIGELAPRFQGRKVVVICQKGKKLSQGAAAMLRAEGVEAQFASGGVVAWRDAGLPLIPADAIPPRDAAGRTVWVTRQRPKIDRIACPWLIRRFVDPGARFLFVAPSEVEAVAEKFDAAPFDVAGVRWTHRDGGCTFDTMLDEFALDPAPLKTLAKIVRGADTNQPELAAQSAGLLAASLGLSRMYGDDLAQLDAGMVIYDALYRWARDAQGETHDWTPEAEA
ncbi:MAG: sulfurtransferase/chromate resistance protein [Pseudomonadota bacterium]